MGDIEELVDTVLAGQHPKMRERCIVDRIVSVFEDSFDRAAGARRACGVQEADHQQLRPREVGVGIGAVMMAVSRYSSQQLSALSAATGLHVSRNTL